MSLIIAWWDIFQRQLSKWILSGGILSWYCLLQLAYPHTSGSMVNIASAAICMYVGNNSCVLITDVTVKVIFRNQPTEIIPGNFWKLKGPANLLETSLEAEYDELGLGSLTLMLGSLLHRFSEFNWDVTSASTSITTVAVTWMKTHQVTHDIAWKQK